MRRCAVAVGADAIEEVRECVPLRMDTALEFSSAGSFKRVRFRCRRCGGTWVEHSEIEEGDVEAAFCGASG